MIFYKKFCLAMVLLADLSLNSFNFPYFSRSVPEEPKPKVLSISLCDPIKFDDTGEEIFLATQRQDIAGIILIINSYGGSMSNFSVLHDMIKNLSSTKPVVALITAAALSGGYLLASAANSIFAHSASDIGSIGVYMSVEHYNNVRLLRPDLKADLSTDLFVAGEYKAITNPFGPELTENDRAIIQDGVLKAYDLFITQVAQNRNIEKNDYKIWAEGKYFLPSEAIELGLIDGIGTIFDAREKIKALIQEQNPNLTISSVDDIEFVS